MASPTRERERDVFHMHPDVSNTDEDREVESDCEEKGINISVFLGNIATVLHSEILSSTKELKNL